MGDGISKPSDPANTTQRSSDFGVSSWFGRGGRPSDTLLIFDWDDTLLCSSALNFQQYDQSQLQQLELSVEAVLTLAMSLGETMIVTNGQGGWVQDSSRMFLPKVVPLLNRMHVTSARDTYEQTFPMEPFAWKKAAFAEILASRLDRGVNLIVLGDSMGEIEAGQMVLERGPSVLKTVKFKEMPSVSELLGELKVLMQMLPDLVNEDSSQAKIFVPRSLPPHLGYLTSWASGWRVEEHRPGVPLDMSSHTALILPNMPATHMPGLNPEAAAVYREQPWLQSH